MWFSYTSNYPTNIEEIVGGSEFCFEIPLNLQVGETLLGLALSFVLDPPTYDSGLIRIGSKFASGRDVIRSYHDYVFRILINGIPQDGPPRRLVWRMNDFEATHVWLKFLYLPKLKQQGDICQVIFRFPKSANIKSCGVHLLLLNQNKRLPLTLGPTSSPGKRWLSLSLEPADDHQKRRQIDLNVPTDIEEEEEEKEPPSTSYEMIENF
ncbi:hypothetical protein C1H46_019610 [Malus baccata]|uniref:Uncharacterized protein n=1 Tax=Malus baccata TaxID=106549 RepID=A0A540M7R5_MALBA|nr:hypothetical protein C1H46_019610 [Malus baccata]